MTIDLHRDKCDRWQFYADWIQDKELAVWQPGNLWNATARNRLSYSLKSGYSDHHCPWTAWNFHLDDIFKINTSAPERQGNPMNPAYFIYPDKKTIDNTCEYHRYDLIMVIYKDSAVAYAVVHIMGELMNISTIIGHAKHLKNGIMLCLMSRIQKIATDHCVKAVTYGTWDSGTDGLRYWKHSVGFEPVRLYA